MVKALKRVMGRNCEQLKVSSDDVGEEKQRLLASELYIKTEVYDNK